MNIKQQIGQRITTSRKQLKMTIKELAAQTQSLSAGRISNWEQGTRSPGPLEAKRLAEILQVAPSYLLCLSDDPRGEVHLQSELLPRFVPLLTLSELKQKNKLQKLESVSSSMSQSLSNIALDGITKSMAGANTFATTIEDTSMLPDFKPGDLIIADPDKKPSPGQYVIVHMKNTKENILRKYRELSSKTSTKTHFELVALNPDWGVIQIDSSKEAMMIATVIEHRRFL